MLAPTLDVPVIVPFRDDGASRTRVWSLIWEHYWPNCSLMLSGSPDGPFNRSAAINQGVDAFKNADVVVVADADSVTNPYALERAVGLARDTGKMVFPFHRWVSVYEDEAEDFLKTWQLDWDRPRKINPLSHSAILVIPRNVWERVNGFDEHFKGWGFEDMAFFHAVKTLTGDPLRLEGDVFHIEHDRDPASLPDSRDAQYLANQARYEMYTRLTLRSDLSNILDHNRVTLV